jgi:hypothetical protein
MARSVILAEPDLDALAELASKLRSRGLTVLLADGAEGLIDRARTTHPDAILLSEALPDAAEVAQRALRERTLGDVHCFVLTRGTPAPDLEVPRLFAGDVEEIVKRLYALPSRPPPSTMARDEFRGDLRKLSVPDLLQLMSLNRRTGSLSVTVPSGEGEVRLVAGEVVDAVFRRLEAEKALFRLLGESEGTFAFTSGLPAPVRRITTPTNALLMDGVRLLDEVRQRRERLGLEDEALLCTSPPDDQSGELARRVMVTLLAPHTVDELLDATADPDHAVLEAVQGLLSTGKVRRIPKHAVRVSLATPEQLAVLGAMVNRLRARGYAGPARIVVATSQRRLATLAHSLRRLSEATGGTPSVPALPLPHRLATLRLSDTVDLEVVGLPVVDALGPVWGLALGGAGAAVRMGAADGGMLDEACAVAGVPLLDAEALLGDVDEADPAQMAALIRSTLDAVAGG